MGLELGLRYRNAASLRVAWRDGLQHGGCVLPEQVEDLEENVLLRLTLRVGDARFGLEARSGQPVPGAGRMLVFESADRLAELGAWIETLQGSSSDPVSPPDMDGGPSEPATRPQDGSDWKAEPGSIVPIYVLKFETIRGFEAQASAWQNEGQVEIAYEEAEATAGQPARLRLTLPGHNIFEIPAWIEALQPSLRLRVPVNHAEFRKALLHPQSAMGRTRREREAPEDEQETPHLLRLSEENAEPEDELPLRQRIRRMGVEDKINLALSGDREARLALATDTNRAIHHYLLKNQRITVDEIAFMARQPSLNPDVLLKIAENTQYVQNQQVVKGLVLNAKTPVSTAIRLLDRLPKGELMALSRRSNMRKQLVMAAKKKLGGA
ncbi:MAG: hypothetical protein AAF627_15475 [Myxococcota bacterium]